MAKEVTENLDKYELGIAVQKVYDFIWEEFCDWYIEMVKPRLYNDEDTTKAAALWTLKTVLSNALKLLHPYMPFITEEIYCTLCPEEESIMISAWPEFTEEWNFAADEEAVETIKEAVRGIRNVRTGMNVPPSKKAKVFVVSEEEGVRSIFENGKVFFATLGYASEVFVQADKEGIAEDAVSAVIGEEEGVRSIFENGKVFFATLGYASEVFVQADKEGIAEDAVSAVIGNAVIYMPFAELVDIEKEIERLKKEEEKLEKELARVNGMLNNERFISKAPESKVQEEREKLERYTNMMEQVKERLTQLQ